MGHPSFVQGRESGQNKIAKKAKKAQKGLSDTENDPPHANPQWRFPGERSAP
jgi:hypothetical protein